MLQALLPWLMLSEPFTQHSIQESKGSTNPYINFPDIAKFEFDLPPLEQQRRIAALLWAVDACSIRWRDLGHRLGQLHSAILERGCTGKVKEEKLGHIVVYASDGPFGSRLKTEHYSVSGARVIRLQNIGKGCFDDSDRAFISQDYFTQLRRYKVCAGDIVVAGLGDDAHPVGRATLVPHWLGSAVNKADCFCVRGNPRKVLNAYLAHFLNSREGYAQILARAQGTTRMRINVQNLKTVRVPLPTLGKQLELIQELRKVECAMADATHVVASLDVLGRKLLSLAFP